jgi:phage tail sheath protein FI
MLIIDPIHYGQSISSTAAEALNLDSSYSAAYWPWLKTIDPGTGQQVWVPASTMIPGVYAFNDNAAEPWYAPAGTNRGVIPNAIMAERYLTQGNRDTLYEANVNPIATFPNSGVVVYGQKTLQKKVSALDRVNVRRLLIELKNYITQVADTLVFEQNTVATRNTFLLQVNPYLASVQQRNGLYSFRVVMDETNNTPTTIDNNQLISAIYLQPTKTVEFIYLTFNVTPTGVSFG